MKTPSVCVSVYAARGEVVATVGEEQTAVVQLVLLTLASDVDVTFSVSLSE